MAKCYASRDEVMKEIKESMVLSKSYERLKGEVREKFLDFCTGVKGLPLTYDPFFKKIFNPEQYPERLSRLISLIIGEKIVVKRVLVNEGTRILEEGSLLIMDIVVELEDGSIANVEIQKLPYCFPGERAACYSSDLLMRQYSKVKKEKEKAFSYKDMKRVYTIVLLEKSNSAFKKIPNAYLHKSKQLFHTGLEIELLQEFIFISLDMFHEIKQNKIEEELDAWLYFICSDEPEVIHNILELYPVFREMYQEIINFRRDIGGVLSMFSEALKIMDQNTVQYMIDELQEELDKSKSLLDERVNLLEEKANQLEKVNNQLEEKDNQLEEKENQLEEKDNQLEEKDNQLEEKENQLEEKENQLEEKENQLEEKANQLEEKENQLREKEKRIKELEALLQQK